MQLGRVLLDGESTPRRVVIEKNDWYAWEGDDWFHPVKGEKIEGNGHLVAPLAPGKIVCRAATETTDSKAAAAMTCSLVRRGR